MKVCRQCRQKKPLDEMAHRRKKGLLVARSVCRTCHADIKKAARQADPVGTRARDLQARQRFRYAPEKRHLVICQDAKRSDRKRGLANDLDHAFVLDLISRGCHHCGETRILMTLDRIDNDIGHVRANVVPACVRCNFLRRDMPHAAWLVVAQGMRQARVQGLFGDWTGQARRRA